MVKRILIICGLVALLLIVGFIVGVSLDPRPSLVRNKAETTSQYCQQGHGRVVLVNKSLQAYCQNDETIAAVVNDFYEPVNYSGNFNVCCVKK